MESTELTIDIIRKWVEGNPWVTQAQLKHIFIIDGIQPYSYIQRVYRETGKEFIRKQYPSSRGKGYKLLYDCSEIVEYAIEHGAELTLARDQVEIRKKQAVDKFLTEREVAIDHGQHILADASVPNEIRAKRFLSKGEILKGAVDDTPACGVYFLTTNADVVYVGQSVNVPTRIQAHRNDKHKTFTGWGWIPVPKEALDLVESVYILMLLPVYNERSNSPVPHLPIKYEDLLEGRVHKDSMNNRYRP